LKCSVIAIDRRKYKILYGVYCIVSTHLYSASRCTH